jgi:hypothetical protein
VATVKLSKWLLQLEAAILYPGNNDSNYKLWNKGATYAGAAGMLLHTLYKWELHNGEIEIISFVVNFSSYPYAIFISSNISGFNFLFLLGFFFQIYFKMKVNWKPVIIVLSLCICLSLSQSKYKLIEIYSFDCHFPMCHLDTLYNHVTSCSCRNYVMYIIRYANPATFGCLSVLSQEMDLLFIYMLRSFLCVQ